MPSRKLLDIIDGSNVIACSRFDSLDEDGHVNAIIYK